MRILWRLCFCLVLGILILAGVVLLPVLLPVAATDNGLSMASTTSNGTFNDLDKLSIGNVTVSNSMPLHFVHYIYVVLQFLFLR